MKLLLFVIPLLSSHAQRLHPSLGWAITMMALLAKIAVPMLLAGKSTRTSGLRSFHAPVMSSRGEIVGFLIEPLVKFPSPSVGTQGLATSLVGSPQVALGGYSDIPRTDYQDTFGRPSYCNMGSSPERPSHFRCFGWP